MKGKKYDAAEKHFIKKQEGYLKEIKSLKESLAQARNGYPKLQSRIAELETEKQQQAEWIERLLELTELSLDDIKKICAVGKATVGLVEVTRGIYKRLGVY